MTWFEGLRASGEGAGGGGVAKSVVAVSDGGASCEAASPEAEPPARSQPVRLSSSLLFVATNLESWETSTPDPNQDEICERCGYRRLDPSYYAWLRSMMVKARQAHARAQLPDEEYELLRIRFNAMHGWALARFGEEVLRATVARGVPEEYRPPVVWFPEDEVEPAPISQHVHPAEGDWPFTEPVTPEAVAKVDAIREHALALGWTEAGLYQNRGRYRFPVGGDYGLVCFLHSGACVGEVTEQWIEIINLSDARLRFYKQSVSMEAARGA